MPKQIALFGGSFNPPHAGHAAILQWLCTGPLNLNAIWVLPTVHHAFDKPLAPYEDRAELVKAMIQDVRNTRAITAVTRVLQGGRWDAAVTVVKREEQYTVETVEALIAENPDTEFTLILGADILDETSKWHRWGDLQRLAKVVFVARKGVTVPANTDYSIFSIDAPEVSRPRGTK